MAVELIDTHTHLDSLEFDNDRKEVVERAREAGVVTFLCVGSGHGPKSARRAVELAQDFPDVYASIGLHPNDALAPFEIEILRFLVKHEKVVAIGETGFDFYRSVGSKEVQEHWFRAQIRLALEFKKPLIIHSRNAGDDSLRVLKEEGAAEVGGVFHCYSEDLAFAEKLQEINFIISVTGNITYKNADALRAVVKEIPLTRLMLETDAPFLAPHPYRGKRCESAYVLETAKKVAEIKGLTLEEVAQATTATARRVFKFEKPGDSA